MKIIVISIGNEVRFCWYYSGFLLIFIIDRNAKFQLGGSENEGIIFPKFTYLKILSTDPMGVHRPQVKDLGDLHHYIHPKYSRCPHSHLGSISLSHPLIYHCGWPVLGDKRKASTQPYYRPSFSAAFSFVHILPFVSCGLGDLSQSYITILIFSTPDGSEVICQRGDLGAHWLRLYKRRVFFWLLRHHKKVLPKKFHPDSPPPALSLNT